MDDSEIRLCPSLSDIWDKNELEKSGKWETTSGWAGMSRSGKKDDDHVVTALPALWASIRLQTQP